MDGWDYSNKARRSHLKDGHNENESQDNAQKEEEEE
jgi:hypothetical protein